MQRARARTTREGGGTAVGDVDVEPLRTALRSNGIDTARGGMGERAIEEQRHRAGDAGQPDEAHARNG